MRNSPISQKSSDTAKAWNLYSARYQAHINLPTDVVSYGANVPTENDLRLLTNMSTKRVVELGCGGAQNAIALAKQGAHAIGIDISSAQLDFARKLIASEKVTVELHRGDAADLAFISANSVELVLSTNVFNEIEDIGRVLRQTHRILARNGLLVISVPHPAKGVVDGRSYFESGPTIEVRDDVSFTCYPRTISDLYTNISRAHFEIDMIVEPQHSAREDTSAGSTKTRQKAKSVQPLVPETLILRARKLGI